MQKYTQLTYEQRLRQFFPKQMALDKVNEKEVFKATDLMNNRPRKCLGYKTPFEVFAELTNPVLDWR
jgi:IS30 family transposase